MGVDLVELPRDGFESPTPWNEHKAVESNDVSTAGLSGARSVAARRGNTLSQSMRLQITCAQQFHFEMEHEEHETTNEYWPTKRLTVV